MGKRQAKGSRAKLQIDFETEYGVVNATPHSICVPINSSQIKSKQNLNNPETITGKRDPVEPSKGNIDVSGSLVVPLDTLNIGFWLKAAFGKPTTTPGTAEGTYKHVFKIVDEQPSLSVQQGFPDVQKYSLFTGCKVGKLGFSFGGDGETTVNIDVMGAAEAIGTASFDAVPIDFPLRRLDNFKTSIKEGGTVSANVRTISIDFDFGLDGDTYVIGSKGFRGAVNEGGLGISGNLAALFKDGDLLDKAIQGRKSSIELESVNESESLTILLPEVIYERNSPSINGPKGIQIELPYKAFLAENEHQTAAVITLINKHESYE